MGKTITDQQIIGRQGESLVSTRANAMGFMFSSYGPLEAGMDGLLEIRDPQTRQASGQLVAVQVKTRQSGNYTGETESGFEYLMNEEDVAYWNSSNLPVIVVLVHLDREELFWKDARSGTGPGGRRLRINRENDRFDQSACEAIAALCVSKGGFGISFPALRSGESGHLNLLQVALPETIYVAASPHKSGASALRELLDHEDRPPDDWIIRGGQFLSFRDPRQSVLKHIVDTGAVEPIGAAEIAFPDDFADEYNIIELLRRTLGSQLEAELSYRRDQRAFYFSPDQASIERTYAYRSLKKWTSADVVKKYEKDGVLKFVRHHAFEPRFWRIGEQWFLSVSPTFVFTWDGYKPDKFASQRLSGKKKLERNPALLGQFKMWSYLLGGDDAQTGSASLFGDAQDGQRLLRFVPVEPLVLGRSVPDKVWGTSEAANAADDAQGRMAV